MAYGNFKYFLEEQRLVKYYVIKDLILRIMKPVVDINKMVYKFLDKKSSCVWISGGAIKYETMPNQQLAEELLQGNY